MYWFAGWFGKREREGRESWTERDVAMRPLLWMIYAGRNGGDGTVRLAKPTPASDKACDSSSEEGDEEKKKV